MLGTQQSGAMPLLGSRGIARAVPSLYHVALVAILGAIFIVALAPRLDTDLWWHLKVGQYIATHRVVPSHDFMSYTFAGHAWTDHEWLAELSMYGLYTLAGFWGPIVAFAAVICATFALVYVRIRAFNVSHVLALFTVAASFVASSASWGPRIQMLTLFLLAAYLALLTSYGRTRDRRLLAAFPVLMILWTNLHGGFVLGLAVLAMALVGEALNRRTGHTDAWQAEEVRWLAIAVGVTAAVTMLNPNGVRQLLYPLTFVLPNAFTNLIEESASPNFHMPVMMVFEAMLLILILSLFVGQRRANWTHLLLALAFTHLAFSQVRNVAVWAVVVGPLVAVYVEGALPELKRQFPGLSRRSRPVGRRNAMAMNLTLLILVTLAYFLETTHYVNARSLRQAEDTYPRAAVTYMLNHRLPQHVFVSYGWGGYLLWRAFPDYRDFMDSRADTLFTSRILRAYLTAYAAAPAWRSVLQNYQVGTVLVEPSAPLAQALALTPGWHRVFNDQTADLFVRS